MNVPKTLEDIKDLVTNEIEESTELEYKREVKVSTPGKDWKKELAKDVSAMANANGGIIIYGVGEKDKNGRSVPKDIIPIPNTEISKDSLSQIISANIQPKIEGIEITTIPADADGVIYVVKIPQSTTAHQNKLTHQYHKRRNATIEAMEDYEIRDVMNRSKYPDIELNIQLIQEISTTTETIEVPASYGCPVATSRKENKEHIRYYLIIRPYNKGTVYANYIKYFVSLPASVLKSPAKYTDDGMLVCGVNDPIQVCGTNTVRDILDETPSPMGQTAKVPKYGPSRYEPVLPKCYGTPLRVDLADNLTIATQDINWVVYVDNAPKTDGNIKLNELQVVTKRR
ncbi:helix-turn-helix domain-containing protein [Alistipes finegoldii]|uniref:AlbA family DNA-binding domain-containing protein n=1 Tax=Alistipes finegoldii TaxID=214856 RepID=UPI00242FAC97|nr:ATP-binding protein [Alistipes finegoldii]